MFEAMGVATGIDLEQLIAARALLRAGLPGVSVYGMGRFPVTLYVESATEKVGRARRCALVPNAFEGISTWLQRLDRFAQVVQRTKGAL